MSAFFDDVGDDMDGVEDRMAAGGLIPEGFYYAKLDGAKETESKSKGTPGYELSFKIQGGLFDGREVTDTLWKTDHQFSKDRIKLAMVLLGLKKRSADGKKLLPVEGKNDFVDCLDTVIVIEVKHEADKEDKSKFWVRIAPNGYHDPNSSKIKDIMAKGGKPIGKGAAAVKEAGKGSAATGVTSSPPPTSPPATATAGASDRRRRL